ncbi:MAG: carboxymuconolactone decarboxylase family protein [Wenzhouxiangellaceae bacterium]|nr:carboxymuconolactone decarboxylase family protein [Wenzhouxiangellaceae bacterium]
MNINIIKQSLPDYAKDLKINLANVLDADQHQHLSPEQVAGVALATAIAGRNRALIDAVDAVAGDVLSPEYRSAARAAAAIMGMNNIYYRFVHLADNDEYGKLPARLRMTVVGNPGIDKVDFELMSLAVSAINGCGLCISSHEKVLSKAGVTAQAIQDAVRIASVMHAVAVVLDTDAAIALPAAA